jgi:hypothetical protein
VCPQQKSAKKRFQKEIPQVCPQKKSVKKKFQRNMLSVPSKKKVRKKGPKKSIKCAPSQKKSFKEVPQVCPESKKNSNLISPPIFITGPQFRDLGLDDQSYGIKKGYTFTITLALKNILLAQLDFYFIFSFFFLA